MWDELVRAYEEKLDVLEAARAGFVNELTELVNECSGQMEAAVSAGIVGSECVVGAAIKETDDDTVFAGAYRFFVPVADASGAARLRVGQWVASCFGGEASTLRLTVEIVALPGCLSPQLWAPKCAERIPETTPGVPFSVAAHPDVPSHGRVIRVASVELADRASHEVAAEVARVATELAVQVTQAMEFLLDAAAPMVRAEQALLAYRPILEARAYEVNAEVYPGKGGLGDYEGGKYLQVGGYWICTDPDNCRLLVESQRVNEPHVRTLAARLGRDVSRRSQIGCLLLGEQQLRDGERPLVEDIADAFDVWFEARAAQMEEALSADDPTR